MFKPDKLELIYEEMLLEYSEPFIKKEIIRLSRETGPHITRDDIRNTIVRFDQLKTGTRSGERIKEIISNLQLPEIGPGSERERQRIEKLKKSPFEITFYSWKDLEHVVHQFSNPADKNALKALQSGDVTGATLIPNTGDLKIYWGKDKNECIAFSASLNKKNEQGFKEIQRELRARTSLSPGKIYNWCIGWVNNNQFDNYRFNAGGTGASVYFVVDESLPLINEYHVIVIHAQQNGMYRITNAFNDNEIVTDWNKVLEWQPKLDGFKDKIVFKPYTEEEEVNELIKNVYPVTFHTITSFKAKEAYINSGKMLLSKDYLELDPALQHLYINVKCGPDVADRSVNTRLHKTLYAFADTGTLPGNKERIKNAQFVSADEIGEMDNDEYLKRNMTCPYRGRTKQGVLKEKCACGQSFESFYNDPIIKQSKGQTYSLWKKFVHNVVNAWLNEQEERRGYSGGV